jgi:hypothetical protein
MELTAAKREFGVYSDETVFLGDILFEVPPKDMQKPPHNFTRAFTFRAKVNNTSSTALKTGTATLISPNLVLTCAHNIYNK